MFQKIVNGVAILSLVLSGGLAGLKYVQSPQFQTKVKNSLMKELKGGLPSAIDKQLPKTTGLGLPL